MPYQLLQGGRRRRRRRRLVAGGCSRWGSSLGVALALARSVDEAPVATPPAAPAPLLESGTAPLAGGGTAPSPLAVRLDDPRDAVRLRFKRPPRSGLLFDVDTGRVLWRHRPTRVLPIASLTKMMTALSWSTACPRGRRRVSPPRRSRTPGPASACCRAASG